MKAAKLALCAIAATLNSAPVFAVNKCTGPDGVVTYQDAACNPDAKTKELRLNPSAAQIADAWSFNRTRDDLTGKTYCIAVSPTQYLSVKNSTDLVHLRLKLATSPNGGSPILMFGATTYDFESTTFHNDLSGTGIKLDGGDFIPFTPPRSQHAVQVPTEKILTLLEQGARAKKISARVRFWPYDKTYDADFSISGFTVAAQKVVACSSQ